MLKKRKGKIPKWAIVSVLLIATAVAVFYTMRPKAVRYISVQAKIGDIATFYSFTGNVEIKNRQTVVADKPMQIAEIRVKENDTVEEGTLLLKTKEGKSISSDIAGEVSAIYVRENGRVSEGTKLMDIVDYRNLIIKVKVDEYDVSALKKGQEVNVKISALNKQTLAYISDISKEGQVVGGVTFFNTILDVVNNGDIKSGMSAEIKMVRDQAEDVVLLPLNALLFDENNQPYVLKKDQKGAIIETEIVVGINDGKWVEVKSGATNGETILYPEKTAKGFRILNDIL